MSARFHCDATCTIPARRYFVLCGHIVDGTVRPGMLVRIPLAGGGEIVGPIDSIEIVSTKDDRGAVGISIKCEQDGEMESLQRLGIRDALCSITEQTQRQA